VPFTLSAPPILLMGGESNGISWWVVRNGMACQISWEEFKAGCEGKLGVSACTAFAMSLISAIDKVIDKPEDMQTFDNQVGFGRTRIAPHRLL